MAHPPMGQPNYRPDIDGLRAIAVLAVIGYHTFPSRVPSGFIGVDIFFVISGFLISSIIFSNLADGRFSYIEFYSRRIRRIFPALLLILLATSMAGWALLSARENRELAGEVAGAATFVANLVLWDESGKFGDDFSRPLFHLWSLGVEEQFYLLWPLLLGLAWRRGWSVLAVIAVVAAASFASDIYLAGHDPAAAWFSPQSRVWELMVGGFMAYLLKHKDWLSPERAGLRAAAGALMLTAAFVLMDREHSPTGWLDLLHTLGAFLIISAGPSGWINRRVLSNKALVGIGLISYPLYLWHLPVLVFTRVLDKNPGRAVLAGDIVLSMGLAWLTWSLIENPVRHGSRGSRPIVALLAVMIAMAGLALAVYFRHGNAA